MLVYAKVRVPERAIIEKFPEDFEQYTKKNLGYEIGQEIAKHAKVIKEQQNHFEHYRKMEVVVLSRKQVEEIGEIVLAFESYAKDYPAMYAVKEKLHRIRDIFLSDNLT